MITGKDIESRLAIEIFIDEYMTLHFSKISMDDYLYLDEVYSSIASKLDRIKSIGTVKFIPMDEYDFVEEAPYQEFVDDYNIISRINYRIIPELFGGLQRISDSIFNISTSVNKIIYNSETTMKAVEEEMKTRLLKKAIKEESNIYDAIGPGSKLSGSASQNVVGDLTIDEQARCITLPIDSISEVPYDLTIECNREKGEYLPAPYEAKTFEYITNGYFYSRMFAENPKLEVEDLDGKVEALQDDDPETGLLLEYNSTSDTEEFVVKFNLEFEESKVDTIKAIFEPMDSESVMGMSNTYPSLTTLHIENPDSDIPVSENIQDRVLDNTMEIEGRKVGEYDTGVNYTGKEVFPASTYVINSVPITNIMLEYTVKSPQEIYYLEKAVYDYRDTETFRFNYFETLVLNNYVVPQNRKSEDGEEKASDPFTWYDQEELAEMAEVIRLSYMTKDEKVRLFRYMVGLKDLKLYKTTYVPKGSVITDNLLPYGKTAAAIELYVNEITDNETSIKYSFSTDKSTWYELVPANRTSSSTRDKRMTFDGFDPKTGDVQVPGTAKNLYMKIDMAGTSSKTPVLNAYSLKVKYI